MALAASEQVDVLAEGLMSVIKPAVEEVDARVEAVRESQVELREYIDKLSRGRIITHGSVIRVSRVFIYSAAKIVRFSC
jgi:hypothetical protein